MTTLKRDKSVGKRRRKPHCRKHPETVLVCPRCIARRGGRATAKKYGTKQLASWGRAGGRPRN
jgi:hypothetical protein